MTSAERRRRADALLAELHHARSTVREEGERLDQLRHHLEVSEKAQKFIQEAATTVQQKAHEQVCRVVTRCVRAVYGDEGFDLNIDFERKRGRTEAGVTFLRRGHAVSPAMDTGGGKDVAAFGLRIVCLLLATPRLRKLLVADEPFKFVNGREYRQRLAILLPDLARELDFQFVIASDEDWLKGVGKLIELGDYCDQS